LEAIVVKKHEVHELGSNEYMLMGIALTGAIIGIVWAYSKYIKQGFVPKEDSEITGFSKTIYNKYYVDEFYIFLIVKPLNGLSNFFRTTLEPALGNMIFGLGSIANELGYQGRKLQNGSIGVYLFAFVIGVCSVIYYLFIAQ
jgi:NADH-quinone oxidoreductase subunit L